MKRKYKKKCFTQHHNRAKARFKKDAGDIFWLTQEHHDCYHKLFKLRTFHEASIVLEKLSQKGRPAVIAMLK